MSFFFFFFCETIYLFVFSIHLICGFETTFTPSFCYIAYYFTKDLRFMCSRSIRSFSKQSGFSATVIQSNQSFRELSTTLRLSVFLKTLRLCLLAEQVVRRVRVESRVDAFLTFLFICKKKKKKRTVAITQTCFYHK